jgi:hypothetical protein
VKPTNSIDVIGAHLFKIEQATELLSESGPDPWIGESTIDSIKRKISSEQNFYTCNGTFRNIFDFMFLSILIASVYNGLFFLMLAVNSQEKYFWNIVLFSSMIELVIISGITGIVIFESYKRKQLLTKLYIAYLVQNPPKLS